MSSSRAQSTIAFARHEFARYEAAVKSAAVAMTLVLPVFLFYGRAVADALASGVAVLFLLRCALARDWRWAAQAWVRIAAALWLLILVASLSAGPAHSAVEALVMARLLLFCAALEAWVLAQPRERRWLALVFTAAAAWLMLQCWQQYLLGQNVMGHPRWSDGALTGPFYRPRAGGAFLMVLFPGLIAIVLTQIMRPERGARLAGLALLVLSVLTMILIGQRMPSLLMLLGLGLTALIVRPFRTFALLALLAGLVALLALPMVSPPTYAKLVVRFAEQVSHFASSPYGQLYTRAAAMVAAHPWLGLGFDGFRSFCSDPAYRSRSLALGPDDGQGGTLGCDIHPHNYYLQVATAAGLPGLLLFVALIAVWLSRMVRALDPARDVPQATLAVACSVLFWPVASTTSLFTFDNAGWVFLLTGWALASSIQPRDPGGRHARAP